MMKKQLGKHVELATIKEVRTGELVLVVNEEELIIPITKDEEWELSNDMTNEGASYVFCDMKTKELVDGVMADIRFVNQELQMEELIGMDEEDQDA